jgi:hypothetical protein
MCLRVPAVHQEEVTLSEQDTTLTDDQIRAESTWGDTPETGTGTETGMGTETEEGDSDGMDTGGGSDSDDSDSDSDGSDS